MPGESCHIHRASAVATLVIAAMVIAILVLAAHAPGGGEAGACAGAAAPAHEIRGC
jgi:multisubunit Na+/H+ antiporter MnhB subunit